MVSNELADWLRADAEEHDVAISTLMEAMIRAAYKKIGVGEALRLGMESIPYRPRRFIRESLDWKVVKKVERRGRMVPEELRFGSYRLKRKGPRRPGGSPDPIEPREPHGRDDQEIDGWYLTGPGLGSPFVWLGTLINEAKRESVVWVPRGTRTKPRPPKASEAAHSDGSGCA